MDGCDSSPQDVESHIFSSLLCFGVSLPTNRLECSQQRWCFRFCCFVSPSVSSRPSQRTTNLLSLHVGVISHILMYFSFYHKFIVCANYPAMRGGKIIIITLNYRRECCSPLALCNTLVLNMNITIYRWMFSTIWQRCCCLFLLRSLVVVFFGLPFHY